MRRFSNKEYDRLIQNLFSRHQSVQNAGFSSAAYKPGLERMVEFDRILGKPSAGLNCIHVAGTNGKGSVCHMLSSAISCMGCNVGLFTSPHISDFRERVKIVNANGFRMISKEDVFNFLQIFGEAIERLELSFFEITTGLAFWWFQKENVDIAVIETGLGGRLDSTNIISCPILSIITSIGLDHCDILGSSREAIAAEKAGIFKKESKALISKRDPQTQAIFEAAAGKCGCSLYFADEMPDNGIDPVWMKSVRGRMDLKGDYQNVNLMTVIRALQLTGYSSDDIRLMEEGLTAAAARSGLKGRWETICEKPLMIADIGHNPPALEFNFSQLGKMAGNYDTVVIIYGVMADKAVDDILPMVPDGENFTTILATANTPRAMKAECILSHFIKLGMGNRSVLTADSVAQAMETALRLCSKQSLIYIGGSTFIVSDAVAYMTSMSESSIQP